MNRIKRCYDCGGIIWPWQEAIKTEKVGLIHNDCLKSIHKRQIEYSMKYLGFSEKRMKQRKRYVWIGQTQKYSCKLATRAKNKEEAIVLLRKEMGYLDDYGWGVLECEGNPLCVCYIGEVRK